MKGTLLYSIITFLCLRCIKASEPFVVNCSETVIMGKYGSSVVLPCWLTPKTDAETLEIRWYRPDQFKNPILFYQNHKVVADFQDNYKNRSSFTLSSPQSTGLKQGDVSLKLDNLALSDIGIFHCYVSGDKSYDSKTVTLSLTALGSLPLLSLEHHENSVNLSCTSSGWYPQPRLLWKFTNKGDVLSELQSPIYTKQENGLFSISSWVLLSSSVSNTISCSVALSEENRDVSVDLGPRLSVQNSGVWKILFVVALLCVLALIGIGLFLYKNYNGYQGVNRGNECQMSDEQPQHSNDQKLVIGQPTNMEDLRKAKAAIRFDVENCNKDYLKFNTQGDTVRDADAAAAVYKGPGFPYGLCVHGRERFCSGRVYWEVGLKQANVPPKKSWLIGVAKASYTLSDKHYDKSYFTPSNGFWFLCLDQENGLHVNSEPEISPTVNTTLESVGVLLDFDKKELSFYSATDGVHLLTMKIDFKEEVVPLFNPGIGDNAPLQIINPQVKSQNEAEVNARV
ncbi:butyrophilin subfamily 2 member A2-like [Tachysurus fulvidraco]|uniref:butyrophilin subfamily 2 member A2-like n=1 Tax=Tachysurus fulvidraco TaxID=1234273 RepID=UPI001FEE1F5F|nr:butyrophilin subfamily 2 member A2-like [Tachysurus fulvidraco]